jgi:hypothetical protein
MNYFSYLPLYHYIYKSYIVVRIFIDPINDTDALPSVVFLAQCLVHFENFDKNNSNFFHALIKLESQWKEYMLENYVSVILSKNNSDNENKGEQAEEFSKQMEKRTSFKAMFINESDDWQNLINVECQRILEANNIEKDADKDWRLFAASLSLARLSQAQYHSPFYKDD